MIYMHLLTWVGFSLIGYVRTVVYIPLTVDPRRGSRRVISYSSTTPTFYQNDLAMRNTADGNVVSELHFVWKSYENWYFTLWFDGLKARIEVDSNDISFLGIIPIFTWHKQKTLIPTNPHRARVVGYGPSSLWEKIKNLIIIIISPLQSTAGHRPLQSLAISLDPGLLASTSCQPFCAKNLYKKLLYEIVGTMLSRYLCILLKFLSFITWNTHIS
jgi:hypothetical protein